MRTIEQITEIAKRQLRDTQELHDITMTMVNEVVESYTVRGSVYIGPHVYTPSEMDMMELISLAHIIRNIENLINTSDLTFSF